MSLPRLAPSLLAALLLAGCLPGIPALPDGGTADGGQPPFDGGELPPGASDVVVTNLVPYVTATETVRAEAVSLPVEVLVPTATGYTRLSGGELAVGQAVVRNVPAGPYLVRSGSAYVYTSARSVNRGFARAERPGAAEADGGVPGAELTLTGLSPWNAHGGYDDLQVVGLEPGGSAQLSLSPPPEVGSTSVSNAPADLFPMTGGNLPRFDPRTDTLAVVQLVAQNVGTPSAYLSARKGALIPAPAYDASAPLRLSAALHDLPQNSLSVDLRSSAFCAPRTQVHPDATVMSATFTVLPAAYGIGRYGWVGYSGELLRYEGPASGEDLATTFSYGDPYPSSWGRVWGADCYFRHRVTLPSGRANTVYGTVGSTDAMQRYVAGPVLPTLLPPQNLRLDGAPATVARASGTSPTLAWDAPASGTPTQYRLTVFRLTESTTDTSVRRTIAATVFLPPSVRSLRLPDGILERGGYYVLRLTAVNAPNMDITRYETAQTLPFHSADTLSSLLSVQ